MNDRVLGSKSIRVNLLSEKGVKTNEAMNPFVIVKQIVTEIMNFMNPFYVFPH